jgi:hypothetical protein
MPFSRRSVLATASKVFSTVQAHLPIFSIKGSAVNCVQSSSFSTQKTVVSRSNCRDKTFVGGDILTIVYVLFYSPSSASQSVVQFRGSTRTIPFTLCYCCCHAFSLHHRKKCRSDRGRRSNQNALFAEKVILPRRLRMKVGLEQAKNAFWKLRGQLDLQGLWKRFIAMTYRIQCAACQRSKSHKSETISAANGFDFSLSLSLPNVD